MSIFSSRKARKNDDREATKEEPAGAPFKGYDRMSDQKLVAALAQLTQVELAATEAYEREHEARPSVLNKLRYLRGSEPIEGYDELETEGVLAALEGSDMETLKRVRGYERKFRGRPEVLSVVVESQRTLREESEDEPAPAYQALGGASVTKRGD